MRKREKAVGLVVSILLVGIVAVAIGWSGGRTEAQDEQVIGRFQFAAPDLILDTATGRLTTGGGAILEPPIDASGKDVGRYSAAGYVTAVPRTVGLDVLGQPTMSADIVKGYVVGDTKTGRILKQRVYYTQPIGPGDF